MRKTTITVAFAAMTFAVPFAVSAQQQAETGAYVGGSFGQAKTDCPSSGGGVTVTGCDGTTNAFKGFIGYRFHRHFAVEGSFMKTDDFSLTGTVGATPFTLNVDGQSMGVAVLGILPLGNSNFSLFGKIGFAQTDSEGSVTVAGTTVTAGADESEAHYGFGAMYNFSRNWAIRAEWERLDKSEVDMVSIGIQFKF